MDRISKALILFVLFAVVVMADPSGALAKSKKKAKADAPNHKYASIVIDANTGAILAQSNADKVLHPASLTKLMTLALTFDAIDKGTLRPTDRIPVSARAASMAPSKLGLKAGSTIRVQDAVNALITKSANDMAVTLAEAVGGSEANFAKMMTAKALSIGMNRSRFVNASGLHDARQVSSARDMAKLARYMINVQSKYYPLFNRKSFTYAGHTYTNHNRMLGNYPGMDGMKTGFVNASGFNLVASAKRGDTRIIGVVFGGRSANSRNLHMTSLLDGGFISANNIRIAQQRAQNSQIASAVSVPSMAAPAPGEIRVIDTASATQVTAVATDATEAQMGLTTLQPRGLTAADQHGGAAIAPLPPGIQARPVAVTTTRVTTTAPQPQAMRAIQVASLATANDAGHPLDAQDVALQQSPVMGGTWSVQVGAFQSRLATDQAIYRAMHKLPANLSRQAAPMIVPLRTAEASWVFRARISGFTTQAEAQAACSHLGNCLVVSPQAN